MTDDITQYEGKDGYALVDAAEYAEQIINCECPKCETAIKELMTQDGCIACEYLRLRAENANLQRENVRINAIIDQQAERFEQLEAEIERLKSTACRMTQAEDVPLGYNPDDFPLG